MRIRLMVRVMCKWLRGRVNARPRDKGGEEKLRMEMRVRR